MGRPKFFTDDSMAINFKLEKDYASQLIKIAEENNEKVSFIVRSIIKSYLDSLTSSAGKNTSVKK